MPHLEVVKIRAGNAQKFRNFRTLLLETPDFPPAPPPQLGVRALYWCTTEAADGSFRLGTVKEDMVFQPRVSGDPLWQIVRHQNKEESNVWSSTAGRTLDAAAATELLDRFLKVEQTGTISEQLPWYAPWSRYYSTGWAAHRLIRQQMELRSAKRPGFRCERRGEVTVQPGSHLRWLVEAPCYSFPVSDVLPESERVRVRSFIFSPLEADKWLIIAEATMLSGQAAFDQFWKDGNGALPVIGTEVRTGNSGQ